MRLGEYKDMGLNEQKIVFITSLIMIFGIMALAEATLYDRGGGLIFCDTLNIIGYKMLVLKRM